MSGSSIRSLQGPPDVVSVAPRAAHVAVWLFVAFFVLVLGLTPEINAITAHYVASGRSELSALERLACFSAIAAMLSSWLMLSDARVRADSRLAVSFLALAVTLYMGEGNLLKEKLQPVAGLLVLLPLTRWLYVRRAWSVILLLYAAYASMGLGWVLDRLPRYEAVYLRIPVDWRQAFGRIEETVETIGAGLVALATVIAAVPVLGRFLPGNVSAWLALHACALVIAIGQGSMHWYDHPSAAFLIAGISFAVVGCLAGALIVWHLRSRFPDLLGGAMIALGGCLIFVLFPALWFKSWPLSIGGWCTMMWLVVSLHTRRSFPSQENSAATVSAV